MNKKTVFTKVNTSHYQSVSVEECHHHPTLQERGKERPGKPSSHQSAIPHLQAVHEDHQEQNKPHSGRKLAPGASSL